MCGFTTYWAFYSYSPCAGLCSWQSWKCYKVHKDLRIKEKVRGDGNCALFSTFTTKSSLFFVVCIYSLNNLLGAAYMLLSVLGTLVNITENPALTELTFWGRQVSDYVALKQALLPWRNRKGEGDRVYGGQCKLTEKVGSDQTQRRHWAMRMSEGEHSQHGAQQVQQPCRENIFRSFTECVSCARLPSECYILNIYFQSPILWWYISAYLFYKWSSCKMIRHKVIRTWPRLYSRKW